MTDAVQNHSVRTLILALVFLPVIGYLLYFGYRKNTESEEQTRLCQEECSAQGHAGYDFKWSALSQPQCQCLD